MITVGREATAAYSPPVGVKPNGTHFKKFAVLFCLQYGPTIAGFRLKAVLQTSTNLRTGVCSTEL